MLNSFRNKKQSRLNKFNHAILLSLLISPMANVYAAQINADSKINAVTVYPGSAKVTRVSKITLAAGDNDIVIKDLPLNLNESSLRVSGEGEGSVSLGSVELSREFQQDVVQEQEKKIRLQIEEVQDERKVIEDTIARNLGQLDIIKSMAFGNRFMSKRKDENQSGSYINLPLDQWQTAWQTFEEANSKVQEIIRQSNKKLTTKDKLINKLKRDLQQVASNQKETRTAKLHINSDSPSDVTLNLTYQINGARWEPVYDADLNTESGGLQLKTLAQISQRTGEDWNGVDVTLSTLRPTAGTQLPRLNPWVLDFMPEQPEQRARTLEADMSMENTTIAESEPVVSYSKLMKPKIARPAPAPMKQQQSRLISADFSAEYKVPGSINLSSGSNKRRFALNSQNLASSIRLASSPRFDPRAMILATTKYQDETPLLAGSMSLYRNGNFVGNAFLRQKLSGEEIKLSFGEDDKVKIKFLPDPDKKRKDGLLFGKKKVVERHYKVSINSNHSKPYAITLSDVFPVAKDENIKVKRLGEGPTHSNVDDKKGVVSWDKVLAPKTDLKIQYGYSVSYPEDRIVPGL